MTSTARLLARLRSGAVPALAALLVFGGMATVRDAASATTVFTGPIDLGTLGGTSSSASAVSSTGQVVGQSDITGDASYHAFSWTAADGMVDLGVLGGQYSQALAVNAAGQVVGVSDLDADRTQRAFLWTQAGGMIDLGTLGGTSSLAYAINASGQVTGYAYTADEAMHAFSWTASGGMVDLGTLGGAWSVGQAVNDAGQVLVLDDNVGRTGVWSEATGTVDIGVLPDTGTFADGGAMNASGQIVGRGATSDNMQPGFSWTAAGGMASLGFIEDGFSSAPAAINNSGQVVGGATLTMSGGTAHAFSWTEAGGIRDLGTLTGGTSSGATGVNASGVVVGISDVRLSSHGSANHAFVWTDAGGMADLGALGGRDSSAYALNDSGLVVGDADTESAGRHAAAWQFVSSSAPTDSTAPAITLTTPVDGASYAQGAVVNADYACIDEVGGSGVASCTGSVPTGTRINTSTSGPHVFTVNAADVDGNPSTKTATYHVVAPSNVNGSVGAGGSISTDTGGGATPDAPLQTGVTSPNAGTIDITHGATTQPAPAGYGLLGFEAVITAPPATVDAPLTFQFTIDAGLLATSGVNASTVAIFRDGVAIGACLDPNTVVAAPDPCVFSRATLGDGDAQTGIYSSHASHWNFGRRLTNTPPLTISTTSLANARVGVEYSAALAATGGAPPVSWSIASGALPAGLTLDPTSGLIRGTPTTAAAATPFTIRAADTKLPTAQSATKILSIAVAPTADPTAAKVGVPYFTSIAPFNGVAPYHWTIAGGSLPGGLALNPATGAISGTPNTEGRFAVTIQVSDSKARKPNKVNTKLTIAVAPVAITIGPNTLANAVKGQRYTATLTASGGTPKYNFGVTSGALPAGISLSSGGVLSGKPTTKRAYTFTVTATDKFGFTAAHAYTITVA